MCKLLLGVIAIFCITFFAPFSAAAQNSNEFESVCAPVSDTEFEQDFSVVDNQQDFRTKIDLLENGINSGFTSVPELDKAQFIESVTQFQIVNNLPVTRRLDQQTLAKVNISNPKSDATSFDIERAKPTK